MDHPDPNADFVEQVLTTVRRLATEAPAAQPVTDVAVATASDLHLPTVRAVLDAEDGVSVTVTRGADDEEAWRVLLR